MPIPVVKKQGPVLNIPARWTNPDEKVTAPKSRQPTTAARAKALQVAKAKKK